MKKIVMEKIIKNARIQKKLKTKELAQILKIDQGLISKFESGQRIPTRNQVCKIAEVLDLDLDKLLIAWYKEKILYEIGTDDLAIEAMNMVMEEATKYVRNPYKVSFRLASVLQDIDELKATLNRFRKFDSYRIAQALELEYTFESNRIEGNTLTLRETDLVVNEGLTISGKSMREHLEAINHKDAIEYVKFLVDKNSILNEREVLSIHNLVLRGILAADAGKYRSVQVMIKGSAFVPPQPFLVAKQMEDMFIWYHTFKSKLHPVVLAAEMHERLVTIHPFIDGNGRTSRLIMNLILLQHGFVIANIKGDFDNRMQYYNALEKSQTTDEKEDFLVFIAEIEKQALERYLSIIEQ